MALLDSIFASATQVRCQLYFAVICQSLTFGRPGRLPVADGDAGTGSASADSPIWAERTGGRLSTFEQQRADDWGTFRSAAIAAVPACLGSCFVESSRRARPASDARRSRDVTDEARGGAAASTVPACYCVGKRFSEAADDGASAGALDGPKAWCNRSRVDCRFILAPHQIVLVSLEVDRANRC